MMGSKAAVQAEDVRASFLFLVMGDLNGQHRVWLGSTNTNRHGVAAFDFATVSACDWPDSCTWRTLDLVRVTVVAPLVTQITYHSIQPFRLHRLFL